MIIEAEALAARHETQDTSSSRPAENTGINTLWDADLSRCIIGRYLVVLQSGPCWCHGGLMAPERKEVQGKWCERMR
ncbi:hypothetical protein E2C01_093511 [Portunus trituberculatus]|uniref:Uncharacterized protein n=1 Tax=Portunus trituberculatus TaxID=210409 RepID=A0A5B7JYF9_PORTR|nr:hypothetical protein [Portunus trituberculatus]